MTMGFGMVLQTSNSTPLKLSFSLVFFPSVTAQSPGAYAIPPTLMSFESAWSGFVYVVRKQCPCVRDLVGVCAHFAAGTKNC